MTIARNLGAGALVLGLAAPFAGSPYQAPPANFDIDQIANSGQCFRFHRVGDKSYNLIAGTHLLNIQQNGRTVRFDCDEDEFNAIWRPYFDLDADYGRCKAAVAKRDIYLQNAVAYGGGLRILRQDLWETILCFIISQQ